MLLTFPDPPTVRRAGPPCTPRSPGAWAPNYFNRHTPSLQGPCVAWGGKSYLVCPSSPVVALAGHGPQNASAIGVGCLPLLLSRGRLDEHRAARRGIMGWIPRARVAREASMQRTMTIEYGDDIIVGLGLSAGVEPEQPLAIIESAYEDAQHRVPGRLGRPPGRPRP